jgi:ribonucleoside-diphosphate reductase alpha chain
MTTKTETSTGIQFARLLSDETISLFDMVAWEKRDAQIADPKGNVIFEQKDVRVPAAWSDTALKIVANKYLHGAMNTPARERGVDELIQRVVTTITRRGHVQGHFASQQDADAFSDELSILLLQQYASFNSPVWFNVGCDKLEPENNARNWHWDARKGAVEASRSGYRNPQCSACFINSVEDSMESIMDLAKVEAMLFKWGSGSGTNLSPIRGANELLSGGGVASGPLSFMRGYDAFAGVIKSGGKTRRAAKMVILDADHPDIEEFIACKGKEEAKAHALVAAGYDGSGPDSEAFTSVSYQNANNSVRLTDEFMSLAKARAGKVWELKARGTGATTKTVDPADLLQQIAKQTWQCGDPGVQFDSAINRWHTCKATGRINASNPCSEYMFLDNSACNLASINLVKYLREDGSFDVDLFQYHVRLLIVAQDILVDMAGYPTETISRNSHDYRPLGLGYANLGALLLRMGLPYDSDEGRAVAAAITSIMGGTAYLASSELASGLKPLGPADEDLLSSPSYTGAFPGYEKNKTSFLEVMDMHREASGKIDGHIPVPDWTRLHAVSQKIWGDVLRNGEVHGFRNAQVTLLAPTGTIGFMMDCDTTGIEPMLGLVAYKKLVGGGLMTLANAAVPDALRSLGYTDAQIERIGIYVAETSMMEGAPEFREEHLAIFDCALRPAKGTRSISWLGHIRMMAAVQPFLSGAISKTVNMPSGSTVEDIAQAYLQSWELGLKAVAIYRDGSKGGQPISMTKEKTDKVAPATAVALLVPATVNDLNGPPKATRNRMPLERPSLTHKFSIGGHEGYITVGLYPNGQPGEIFIRMAKEGSIISGLMDSFATSVSLGFQHGVPLSVFCGKFSHMRFEPSGWTGSEEIGYAKSIMDYLFRWLELRFLTGQQLEIFPASKAQTAPLALEGPPDEEDLARSGPKSITDMLDYGDAPTCLNCGSIMQRAGKCHVCSDCGTTFGSCS